MAVSSEISGKSLRARQVRGVAGQILNQLFLASKVQQLYGGENENVRRSFDGLVEKLHELFETERTFRLHLEEGYLFVNETRLRLERATADSHYWFLERFAASGLASLTIDPGVTAVELKRLVPIIARAVWPEGGSPPPIQAELQTAFVTNARVTMRRTLTLEEDEADRVEVSSARLAGQLWLRLRRAAAESCAAAKGGEALSVRRARAVLQLVIDAYLEDETPLLAITAARARPAEESIDKAIAPYLPTHMANTAILAIGLGHRLGMERRRLLDVGTAALHADISLARIPRDALDATGPIPEPHRSEAKAHALRSAELLIAADGGAPTSAIVASAVARHHVIGKKGVRSAEGRRSLPSAIIGVADVYDALQSDRPWRSGRSHAAALAELLEDAGDPVEASLVRVFANMLGMYPVGAAVELSSGEVAVVVEQNPDPRLSARPRVKVLIEADGEASPGRRLDTAEIDPRTGRPVTIARTVDLGLAGPGDVVAVL